MLPQHRIIFLEPQLGSGFLPSGGYLPDVLGTGLWVLLVDEHDQLI